MKAFYQCWTRKEAYLKALGEGLSRPLNEFTVTFLPEEKPVVDEHPEWTIYDLTVHEEYAGAAVEASSAGLLKLLQFEAYANRVFFFLKWESDSLINKLLFECGKI